jgi:hypothetical protein
MAKRIKSLKKRNIKLNKKKKHTMKNRKIFSQTLKYRLYSNNLFVKSKRKLFS